MKFMKVVNLTKLKKEYIFTFDVCGGVYVQRFIGWSVLSCPIAKSRLFWMCINEFIYSVKVFHSLCARGQKNKSNKRKQIK